MTSLLLQTLSSHHFYFRSVLFQINNSENVWLLEIGSPIMELFNISLCSLHSEA